MSLICTTVPILENYIDLNKNILSAKWKEALNGNGNFSTVEIWDSIIQENNENTQLHSRLERFFLHVLYHRLSTSWFPLTNSQLNNKDESRDCMTFYLQCDL